MATTTSSITARTRDELFEDLTAYAAARTPGVAVTSDTDLGVRLAAIADALGGMQSNHIALERDQFPRTAAPSALLKHAEARLGPDPKKAATKATGTAALKVYGTAGSVVAVGDQLSHTNGKTYKLTKGGTIPAVSPLEVLVDVESVDTGTAVNLKTGAKLTFTSPPTGIQSVADVVAAIDGAEDIESDGALLKRVEHAIVTPPAGGRASDYVAWATAVTGVQHAFVYPPHPTNPSGRSGIGSVDIAIVKTGSGTARIPTSSTKTAVEDAIADLRPAGVKSVKVVIPTAKAVAFDIQVLRTVGYENDWKRTTTQTVAAWDAVTKKLTWSGGTRPTEVVAGVRVACNGEVIEVDGVDGADKTIMKAAFVVDPSGATIYSAGPTTQPSIDAVKAYVDGLGPARGTAADPQQKDWDDAARLADIFHALMSITGVKDVVIITPAANVTAIDNGTTIELLYASIVEIRD